MNNLWKKTDSILFDLDGTLWDSVKSVTTAWNLGAKKINKDICLTEDDVRGIMGLTSEGIKEKLFPAQTKKERDSIFEQCCHCEQDYVRAKGGLLYPKVAETLKALAEKKPLFIVSNCGEGYIQSFLDYYDFWSHFQDFEYFARTEKEKSENIKLIMQRNCLKTPVYVGDTQGDRDAAAKAEVPFIYVSYGFGKVTDYQGKIETFADLATLF